MKKLRLNREVLFQLGQADLPGIQGASTVMTDMTCIKVPVKKTQLDCTFSLQCPTIQIG